MTLPLVCGHIAVWAQWCCQHNCSLLHRHSHIVLLKIISNLIVQLHRISSCILLNFTLGSSTHMHYQQQQHNLHPDENTTKKITAVCVCITLIAKQIAK